MRKAIYKYEDYNEYKKENAAMWDEHKVSHQKLPEGNDCIITFEKPEHSDGAMRFVYVAGVLTIQGDYGYSVFNWYNKNNHILAYLSFDSFEYVMSKLVSGRGDDVFGFNSDLCEEDIMEFLKNRVEEGYLEEIPNTYIPYMENQCQATMFMIDNYDKFGGDLEGSDYEPGKYLEERSHIQWFGLQTAIRLLDKQGAFKDED